MYIFIYIVILAKKGSQHKDKRTLIIAAMVVGQVEL